MEVDRVSIVQFARMSEEDIFREYSDMRLDMQLIQEVCTEYGFPYREAEVAVFGKNITLMKFMSTFRSSGTRHDFLAHYALAWEREKRKRKVEGRVADILEFATT